jgi:hypothetical protein
MLHGVIVRKAFRYRVYPNETQSARLAAWEGALRFLWNLALEQRRYGLSRPRDERIFPTAFDQISELTALRAALPWLADVPRNVCGQLLAELDKARRRSREPERRGHDPRSLCAQHRGRGMVPLRGALALQDGVVRRLRRGGSGRVLQPDVQRLRRGGRKVAPLAIRLRVHFVWLP